MNLLDRRLVDDTHDITVKHDLREAEGGAL
jgi:hypothetical protein